ncbi:phosphatase PAP2 family protein [Bremerella sp. P1]|uniref:phosphatase PAP2 family protein n=1 Tax=Bremerella sp. P1 TaxID=3026424 RepID=UPI0023681648|nr:phosphatase PAP2 family protein [Bremerella sp. P1]WDI44355.1 phosphatase PAP2 family protein [Bremerella sp. P1]
MPDSDHTQLRPQAHSFQRMLIWMAIVPLTLLATITALCYLTQLDLVTTHQFFRAQGEDPFPYGETLLATTIYDYGPIPAILFGVASVATWIGSYLFASLASWRKSAMFCSLAILIGPGILINTVLKPNWGRPRPIDTVVFGGEYNYVPPGTIGPYEMAKSFPSGHASMGFVFLLPAFLLLRKNPTAAACVFVVGFLCGAGVGASRIAEGGHYLSDIAWSGAIVYFTGLTLYVGMYGWKQSDTSALSVAETVPFSRESHEDNVRKNSAA